MSVDVSARRCAGCNNLKWSTSPERRTYVCRQFGQISAPDTSCCDRWRERTHEWTHEAGMLESIGPGLYPAALTVGLPPLGLRELCALPDFPGINKKTPEGEKLRASYGQLLTWLDMQVKARESDEVRIC